MISTLDLHILHVLDLQQYKKIYFEVKIVYLTDGGRKSYW